MGYQVISTFRDLRTGDYVEAGQDLPEGLDVETIARLVEAKCLKPLAAGDLLGEAGGDDQAGAGGKGGKGKK